MARMEIYRCDGPLCPVWTEVRNGESDTMMPYSVNSMTAEYKARGLFGDFYTFCSMNCLSSWAEEELAKQPTRTNT